MEHTSSQSRSRYNLLGCKDEAQGASFEASNNNKIRLNMEEFQFGYVVYFLFKCVEQKLDLRSSSSCLGFSCDE